MPVHQRLVLVEILQPWTGLRVLVMAVRAFVVVNLFPSLRAAPGAGPHLVDLRRALVVVFDDFSGPYASWDALLNGHQSTSGAIRHHGTGHCDAQHDRRCSNRFHGFLLPREPQPELDLARWRRRARDDARARLIRPVRVEDRASRLPEVRSVQYVERFQT